MRRATIPLIIAGWGCLSWNWTLAESRHYYKPAVLAEQSEDDEFYPALKPGQEVLLGPATFAFTSREDCARFQAALNSGQIVGTDGAKAWLDQNCIFARNIGERNATSLAMPVESVADDIISFKWSNDTFWCLRLDIIAIDGKPTSD